MKVELASNGWSTKAVIKVILGARPTIIGRDLMPHSDATNSEEAGAGGEVDLGDSRGGYWSSIGKEAGMFQWAIF